LSVLFSTDFCSALESAKKASIPRPGILPHLTEEILSRYLLERKPQGRIVPRPKAVRAWILEKACRPDFFCLFSKSQSPFLLNKHPGPQKAQARILQARSGPSKPVIICGHFDTSFRYYF
jgi:hypothetical protein